MKNDLSVHKLSYWSGPGGGEGRAIMRQIHDCRMESICQRPQGPENIVFFIYVKGYEEELKFFKDTALPKLENLTSIVKNKLNNSTEVMEKAREKYGFSQAYKKAKRKGKTSRRHVKQITCHKKDTQQENKKEQAVTIDDSDLDDIYIDSDSGSDPDSEEVTICNATGPTG